jgi:hypothetical protein
MENGPSMGYIYLLKMVMFRSYVVKSSGGETKTSQKSTSRRLERSCSA